MTTETTITPTANTSKSGPAAPKKVRVSKNATKSAAKKALKATATKKRLAKATASKKTNGPKKEARADTKKSIVFELLHRKQGATTAEIAKATDWQNHSIRGFISGHVVKKMGITVESIRGGAGDRSYRIAK